MIGIILIVLSCCLSGHGVIHAHPSPMQLITHTINACTDYHEEEKRETLKNYIETCRDGLDLNGISLLYNISDEKKHTQCTIPLAFIPVLYGNTTVLKILLDAGVDPNTRQMNLRRTLLMQAAQQADVSLVRMLMSYFPDVNAVDNQGDNALSLALVSKKHKAVLVPKVVAILCKYGARLPEWVRRHMGCLKQEYSIETACILLKTGVFDLTRPQEGMNTLLIHAVKESDHKKASDLLHKRADPNGSAKEIPLKIAAGNYDFPMVQLLLNEHADVNRTGNNIRHNALSLMLQCVKKDTIENEDIAQFDAAAAQIINTLVNHGASIPWDLRSKYQSCMSKQCHHRGLCKPLVEKGLFHGGKPMIPVYDPLEEFLLKDNPRINRHIRRLVLSSYRH